jgi:hypothetical protein
MIILAYDYVRQERWDATLSVSPMQAAQSRMICSIYSAIENATFCWSSYWIGCKWLKRAQSQRINITIVEGHASKLD